MKCPIDSQPLAREIYEADVEIDVCSTCGGCWLSQGELEQIQETVEKEYAEEIKRIPPAVNQVVGAYHTARQDTGGKIKCPVCTDTELARREYGYCSQIMIDVCPSCEGIWLHRGELKALEIFFERSRMETPKMKLSFLASLKAMFKR